MKRRLLLAGLLILVFAAGVGVGFLRSATAMLSDAKGSGPQKETRECTTESADTSDATCKIGYDVSEDFFSDVPTVENWQYPESKITRKDEAGGGGIGVLEWKDEERLIMTTPDNIDKVWNYYEKKLGLNEEGDMSRVSPGFATNEPGKVTFSIFEELERFAFPLPKSDNVQVKLFSMGSHRYHVVVCIFRAKQDDKTSIVVAYRKNQEALSLLRDLVKKNP